MLDPMTAATIFATIVSLLSSFKGENRAQDDDEYRTFMNWLEETRQEEVLEEIERNRDLSQAIKNLIEQNQDQVLQKLESINKAVFKIASHIEGFSEITNALNKNLQLSEQAWSILKQLDGSGGSFFLELKTIGGCSFQIMDGNGGMLEINEIRFIEDDLQTLVGLGLLIPDSNKSGYRLWRITREAANLVKAN